MISCSVCTGDDDHHHQFHRPSNHFSPPPPIPSCFLSHSPSFFLSFCRYLPSDISGFSFFLSPPPPPIQSFLSPLPLHDRRRASAIHPALQAGDILMMGEGRKGEADIPTKPTLSLSFPPHTHFPVGGRITYSMPGMKGE